MNSTFSCFSSIFGFIVAVVSLFAFIAKISRSHLPSNKIKTLESLLDETETFFKKAIEDGLLTEPNFVDETERHLTILRTRTYVLRSSAYGATTLYEDYMELLKGTSSAIGRACASLRRLRAHVVISSQKGRSRQPETNSTSHAASPPDILPLGTNSERYAVPLPSTKTPRPRSCPPILSEREPDDPQRAFAQGNPLHDPMQGGLDVRTADAQICASTVHTSSVIIEPGA